MKVSDFVIQFLVDRGVTHVFGYPGGAITHLMDSISRRKDIQWIGTYHEQGAAFAAEGYARVKNSLGVAMATSGPGATNLITGIGSAYFDSVPCLYITGQVNTYEYKGTQKIRQLGFQETDIVSIVKPIVKYAVRITDPRRMGYEMEKVVHIAMSGRKGPVLLDIPMNVQRADISLCRLPSYRGKEERGDAAARKTGRWVHPVLKTLQNARRPVILAGGGIRTADAVEELERFAGRTRIPVVSSLMGLDAYDATRENYFGLVGAYGNRYGNLILANSDWILALGPRMDSRQTGTRLDTFAREAKLIRVDIDRHELGRKVKAKQISIPVDVQEFLRVLNSQLEKWKLPEIGDWLEKTSAYRERYPSWGEKEEAEPNRILHVLSSYVKPNSILCLDVGQNQIWAAQSFRLKKGQRMLLSGGMGAMGFSLPAAIGAYYASPGSTILALTGDGGIQMNIQELQLLQRNRIPVKLLIMNNNCLGMIRHFQEMYFEGRYGGTLEGYSAPDFCKLARAYGMDARTIECVGDLKALDAAIEAPEAVVFDIKLNRFTYVFPKLAVNRPIEDQEPLLERKELYENMLVEPWEREQHER